MGKFSLIEWCHHTFNSWVGCCKVSPGCENCYAAVDAPARIARSQGDELWGKNAARKVKAESGWSEPLAWDRAAAKAGERHRVFSASQSDVFEDREDLIEPRSRLFRLILKTPYLDWLLLTKRPENIARLWPTGHEFTGPGAIEWPNVWLGTSVEDQKRADDRIPHLLRVPAAVRFLSMEPLLSSVNVSRWLPSSRIHTLFGGAIKPAISWVIVGGESGPHSRPMHPQWARDIRDQCVAAGVAFLFKQWGEYGPSPDAGLPESLPTYGPTHHHYFDDPPHKVWKFGKKAAGRLLDGRTWDEFPTVSNT